MVFVDTHLQAESSILARLTLMNNITVWRLRLASPGLHQGGSDEVLAAALRTRLGFWLMLTGRHFYPGTHAFACVCKLERSLGCSLGPCVTPVGVQNS